MSASDRTVSVIVPAFEAEPYLDAALASIAGQTRQPDEVVVIDDASSDATADIARRWSAQLPIELIIKPVNEGLGAARATGISRSTGELLALLDSDDVWLPEHLDVMMQRYEQAPGIITAGNFRWWPGRRLDPTPSYELNTVPKPDDQRLEILRRNFLFVCTLFARTDYDAAGGFSSRRRDEDWDLWIRMLRNAVTVATTDVVTVLYRQRLDSLSGQDGCLDDDIDLLESLTNLDSRESDAVATTLRHLRARRQLLDGYEMARSGQLGQARRTWLRAALHDRSLRLGPGQSGSTSLRALACVIAPRRVVRFRDERTAAAPDG